MFKDREEAGKLLAGEVEKAVEDKNNAVILAIPRGVPVAYQISKLEYPSVWLSQRK
ncbi:MAG: hypothetical protein Q9M89_03890 [Persephonella sp.]|nr:hypothetical protein [Persephonella sp.]